MNLNEQNKSQLKEIINFSDSDIAEFCKLSWEYLAKGPVPKMYGILGEKLACEAQEVQNFIEAISNLLIESCKRKVSRQKFKEFLGSLGFSESQIEILYGYYSAKQSDLTKVLLRGSIQLPTFRNLEWRVQVKLGSRALPNQLDPTVLLALTTTSPDPSTKLLECDPGTLAQITNELEQALSEASSQHSRRVQRRFAQQPSH